MIVTGIIPANTVELKIKTDQASEAVRQFKERHPAALSMRLTGNSFSECARAVLSQSWTPKKFKLTI